MDFIKLGMINGMDMYGCIVQLFQYSIVKDGAIYTASYREYPNLGKTTFIGEDYYRFEDAVEACQWHVNHHLNG